MATDFRNPISDEAVAGTWTGTAGQRWTLVDDYPDTVPTDWLRHGTTAGNITFTFSSFNIPSNATGISVQVLYYDKDVSSGNNNLGGRLKVGGSYFNAATHNPSTTLTSRTDNWANNPKTVTAWTVNDINGLGVNAIQAFGLVSTDASPQIDISCIRLQVTYTLPQNTGYLSGIELEIPNAPRYGKLTGIELELPDAPIPNRTGYLTGIELEIPTAPRFGKLTGIEFEIPIAPRFGKLTGIELEIPDKPTVDRFGKLSGLSFEMPSAPRCGKLAGIELEIPIYNRTGILTGIELEIPSLSTTEIYIWSGIEWIKAK